MPQISTLQKGNYKQKSPNLMRTFQAEISGALTQIYNFHQQTSLLHPRGNIVATVSRAQVEPIKTNHTEEQKETLSSTLTGQIVMEL